MSWRMLIKALPFQRPNIYSQIEPRNHNRLQYTYMYTRTRNIIIIDRRGAIIRRVRSRRIAVKTNVVSEKDVRE